jgi:predicted NACHT family NTPase
LCGLYQRQSQLENVLTGVPLSLDEGHYVQLALVKEEEHKKEEEGALSKSAYREERVSSYEKIHEAKTLIELERLFQRTKEDKQNPKKLLILGRAGIGKTTLCQYVTYRWSKGTLWNDQFDAVFWVPLRELPSYSEEDTKPETILLWLMQQCWNRGIKLALNKESISEYLKEHQGKLLFLLDGYDEVAHLKGEKTTAGKFIDFFLCQEYTVLTSRPNYVDTLFRGTEKQIDRCLENIGFTNTHIEKYVQHFFVAHGAVNQEKALLAYLKQNLNIWGIAHVPINLSLICSVWYNDSQKGLVNIASSKTMTGLYDRMVDALLDRYLEKMLSREEPSRLSNRTKEKKKVTVVRFLSRLGFVVTQKSTRQIIISAETFNTVFNEVFEKEPTGLSCDDFFTAIHKTGFLTPVSSHRHHQQNNKDCYFLHLTFQEYFTARYLIEVFSQGIEGAEEAITCLKQHKFDPNYEVVWWFTAGLIVPFR